VDISSHHHELDTSRARQWLDWEPRHSLKQSLPRMLDALKADPPAWYRASKLDPALVADESPAVRNPAPTTHDVRQHRQPMRQTHFEMLWAPGLNILLGAHYGSWDRFVV
jgi:hypothetical protein